MRPFTTVLIVPTGIGAAIGGYAGDALPVARVMAQVSDRLITHPNVVNGASLYWPLPNVLYCEGYGLDRFAAGDWGLAPVRANRIGLLLDAGIEDDLRWRHLQVADAARATLGLEIGPVVTTSAPLGVSLRQAESGATWGTIERPEALLAAGRELIDQGAQAIAVIARFPDDPGTEALTDYRHGQGVDPLSGAEAVISHLLVREFGIPCAHAPALSPLDLDPELSPRSAAEELGHTFLPCVLAGLSRAPRFTTAPTPTAVTVSDVDAVVVPASACGGPGLLAFAAAGVPILTVSENPTTLAVTAEALGLGAIACRSYAEAVGVLTALKAGVSPRALTPFHDRLGG